MRWRRRTASRGEDVRLRLVHLAVSLALLPGAGCAGGESGAVISTRWEAVDREVEAFYIEHGLPGVSVVVLEDGEVTYQRAFGWANREARHPVTATTLFPIGSIEKEFTAAAVMRLVDDGSLGLDDVITEHLPGLYTGGHDITIRQMLHMTSGLQEGNTLGSALRNPDASSQPAIADRTTEINAGLGFDPAAAVAGFDGEPLYHPPGERWTYSQPNYDLMSLVIAKLSGKTYYEVTAELARASGMQRFHAEWTPPPPSDDPGVAHGYVAERDSIVPVWEQNTGAAWTTATDLARWAHALHHGRVVSPQSYTAMRTPARLRDGRDWPYGLGLMLADFEGRPKIMHTGRTMGHYSVLAFYPEEDIAIAVQVNLGGAPFIQNLERRIARIIFDAELPVNSAEAVPLSDLSVYVGSYDAGAFWFDVTLEGPELLLTARDPGYVREPRKYWQAKLHHRADGRFIALGQPDWLRADFDLDRTPVELHVTWPAQTPSQALRRR
jgi:D-alanyl-D-alanine carboxypeptidase